jgi:hypothetical protein
MSLGDEPSAHHHASHRHLLAVEHAEYAPHAHLDAVIVPTARPVESLSTAIDLASRLGCVLVALCSKNVSADQVAANVRNRDVSTVAININEVDGLPTLETSLAVDSSQFRRTTDLSRKRNLGLLLARVAGWQRVMFLDDDIDDVHASDVRAAAGLLNRYNVVGFVNRGFADNSVVCRASRYLGQPQDQFMGAGAMVVAPHRMRTFFPNIYNEDWFFLTDASRMAVIGSVKHRAYDNAIEASRAREEELGDCLGEGLYWALDEGTSHMSVGREHWRRFLDHRRWFIEWLDRVNNRGPQSDGVTAALDAAHERCDRIAGERSICSDYMNLWHTDLAIWRDFIVDKPAGFGLVKALTELGWYGIAQLHLLPWHEEDRLIFPNGRELQAADQQARRPPDRTAESPQLASASTHGGVTG